MVQARDDIPTFPAFYKRALTGGSCSSHFCPCQIEFCQNELMPMLIQSKVARRLTGRLEATTSRFERWSVRAQPNNNKIEENEKIWMLRCFKVQIFENWKGQRFESLEVLNFERFYWMFECLKSWMFECLKS